MISSTGNTRIRALVRLKKSSKERESRGAFLVEGPKMFREIPRNMCLEVYASESFYKGRDGAEALSRLRGTGAVAELVSDAVFEYLSDTKTPQGIMAVVKKPVYGLQELMGPASCTPMIIILENVQDPGNLGTIVRTAEAAGASGVLLSKGCADMFNPKTVRSTMGSIFRVPFSYVPDLKEAVCNLKDEGVRIYSAHLRGSKELYECGYDLPCAFMIGNESRGLTGETAALSDQAVRIPMSGSVESLNAAVASAVFMFEAKRQRCAAEKLL